MIRNPSPIIQMNNSNYIFNGLPHYDVFKQKVSKQIELSNSYSTKIMGHKGSEDSNPTLTNATDPFKSKLLKNWNMYVLP